MTHHKCTQQYAILAILKYYKHLVPIIRVYLEILTLHLIYITYIFTALVMI